MDIIASGKKVVPDDNSEDRGGWWLEEHGLGLSRWDEQPAFGDDCKINFWISLYNCKT